MAATNYTPIQLYRTTTASATPSAGNLAAGELAINLTDEKLYFKNASGTVKLLAANLTAVANGGTGATTFTTNGLLYGNGTSALQVTAAGTTGQVLVGNTGSAPSWAALSSSAVTSFSAGTTGLTPSTGTTGAVTLAGTLNVANGGTGASTAATARTNLGATTVGGNLFTLTNPSAVTFPRFNADNTVSALDAATFRSAIGAGTGSGTVTSVGGTGTVNGITLTGTVTSSGSLTLGGTLSGVSLTTQVTGTLPVANGGTGVTTSTGTGSVVLSNSPTLVTPTLGAASATSIAAALGAVGTPSYTFTGDTNTGIYSPGADTLAFVEGGVEAMRINSSGNVGIGTSSPSSYGKLTVNGSVILGAPSGRNTAATNYIGTWTTGDPSDDARANIGFTTVAGAASSSSYITFATNNYGVSGGERMRIDSSGNVGIGTSSPKTRLQTSAGTQLNAPVLGNASNAPFYVTNNDPNYGLVVGTSASDGHVWLQAQRTDTATAYNITLNEAGGNVGIGTSSPAGKLDVTGSSGSIVANAAGDQIAYTYNGFNYLTASGAAATLQIQASGASGVLTFATAGSERFRITSTGAITSSDLADAVGYKGIPQNAKTASYTLALSDIGKHISITTGGVVIPANGSVAFPVGSTIVIYNNSGSTQTISITTDTLRQAGTTNTGTRTLAVYGVATCIKVASTTWVVSGNVS